MARHANIAFFIPHLGCPHRCAFCSQRTISGEEAAAAPETVRAELEAAFARELDPASTEIAFFGGSFTCLPRERMEEYLAAAAPYVRRGQCAGIRVSTRPDGIDGEILALLARYGVTAIELGAQSLDDRVLARNGRGHSAADVWEASRRIRAFPGAPFSLGLQIMTGLDGEDAESRSRTREGVLAIRPDTLRIYPTVVLEGTVLAERLRAGTYHPPGVAETAAFLAPMLAEYEAAGIRIIRVGLHASAKVERAVIGGAYHPAMRELCEAARFRRRMETLLAGIPPGEAAVAVHPRALSRAVGQKKENLRWAESCGYRLRLVPDSGVELDGLCLLFPEKAEIRVLRPEERTGSDCYEFALPHAFPGGHWNANSFLLPDGDAGIGRLAPCLEQVFPQFAWYGPQKVPLSAWARVEALAREDAGLAGFFAFVRRWLEGRRGEDFFWILGI